MTSPASNSTDDQSTSNSQSWAEQLKSLIKKSQKEIEEFILQLSLGKADADKKYDEVRSEFSKKISEWKLTFAEYKKTGKQTMDDLKKKLEELELQLSLGKAEAADTFSERRKKIVKKLNELEAELKNNPDLKEARENIQNEIEKFKLKLEILAQHLKRTINKS
jgi:hypothetical protein